ncbi:hypothetical protein FOA43_002032 [Brettanomyces nanus]|uniref:Small ribosomal subunit protein mS29 n=1 Tax=Eeniella nana TaxID=13502 RepID=A0A875S4K2_EENNA|nr:uncharacterized protein FOA43_002032 [Brettanomyces nanus]QPG74699.1 hypothetical protein FOA43_002032 [Brettanomyces nanus]
MSEEQKPVEPKVEEGAKDAVAEAKAGATVAKKDAEPVAKKVQKSFNKKTSYDRGKRNRKGQGSEKSFVGLLKSSNFKEKAKDSEILDRLPAFNGTNLRLGEIARYDEESLRKMYISGSFKPLQFNELYSKPVTLIRSLETAKLAKFYSSCLSNQTSSTNRMLITGPPGVGKSTILSQFQALALGTTGNAILLPISDAEALVDGSSDFKLNSVTGLYDQQMYAKTLLKKIIAVNKPYLSDLKLSEDFVPIYSTKKLQESQKLDKDTHSLLDLASIGATHQTNSTYVFVKLLKELSSQKQYPVFITIDNISAFVQNAMTNYRDADNVPIHFQKFQLANTLVDYLSGDSTFVKGGIVASIRGSDKHVSNETIAVGLGLKQPNLYKKFADFDRQFADKLIKNGGINHLPVSKFSVDECQTLLSHMLGCNVIHNEYQMAEEVELLGQEEYITKLAERKYLISGNGNARLLVESCVLAYV